MKTKIPGVSSLALICRYGIPCALLIVTASCKPASSGFGQALEKKTEQAAVTEDAPLPPGGVLLAGPEDFARASLGGSAKGDARLERVPGGKPEIFPEAARVTVNERTVDPWGVELRTPLSHPPDKGDVLLIEFWARKISSKDETGEGRFSVVLEQTDGPFLKAVRDYPFSAGDEWKHFTLRTVSEESLRGLNSAINFRLGSAAQEIEIGGLRVWNYGGGFDLNRLPANFVPTYAGREPDAAWRREAAERIEKIRKGDLKVVVRDAQGNPVSGAKVEVREVKSAFKFGAAISDQVLLRPENEVKGSDQYRKKIAELFNSVSFENALKWPRWEGKNPDGREQVARALDWFEAHGLEVRGHVLLWPGWRNVPKDLPGLGPDQLRERIFGHVSEILTDTGARIRDWDVVNEPQNNNDLMRVLGDGLLVDVFQKARELHPQGHLFLNEAVNFNLTDKMRKFEEMALKIREQGGPVDGLGIQSHYAWECTPPAKVIESLDSLSRSGLVLQITEFDMNVTDETLQADYLRDFFTAAFSHPAVDALQIWDFWEGATYAPNAALWRKDWTPKPAGQVYMDLVLNQWRTHADLVSDASGAAGVRGFLGDYAVVVRHGDQVVEKTVQLPREGTVVEINLPAREAMR